MTFMRRFVLAFLALIGVSLSAQTQTAPPPTEVLAVKGIGDVTIYSPTKPVTGVVLFISGDGGWNKGVVDMAVRLRQEGAVIIGVDIRQLFKTMNASSSCGYPSGSLEELARS